MTQNRVPQDDSLSGLDHGHDEPLTDFVERVLQRLEEDRGGTNACITVSRDLALADAARVAEARAAGQHLPLDGLCVIVKDNIDVGGVRTTRGSDWFANRVPATDATVIRHIRRSGAIVVGKASLHEFAYGGTNNNPHFGTVRNPWDLSRIPGGSSGGSAASVAAELTPAALGTDTGGSVRCPAALCGVTGLRPTFGVVSNHGVFPIGASFDTVGPMARRAADVARLFGAMVGQDPLDPDGAPYLGGAGCWMGAGRLDGMTVGVPHEYFFENLDPSVARATSDAIDVLVDMGARRREIAVEAAARANEVATLVIRAEALALHHGRLEEDAALFGEDVARRLNLGFDLAGWKVAGLYRELRQLRLELRQVLAGVDVVVTPTTPQPAPKIADSEMIATTATQTRFTYPWSVAHVPAISIPCGFSEDGLPIGLQLVGPAHSELLLCGIADAYQGQTDWHLRRSPVALGVSARPE